jgi:uncharacterized protein (TIGR00251 family)
LIEAFAGGVRVRLYVQPNGRKSEVLGEFDGALKIRVQAPPVEGKANEAVETFVAKLFQVSRRDVSLLRGQQSRSKQLEIRGLDVETAQELVRKIIASL